MEGTVVGVGTSITTVFKDPGIYKVGDAPVFPYAFIIGDVTMWWWIQNNPGIEVLNFPALHIMVINATGCIYV